MVQPFANVAAVSMNPPPEYAAAVAAYERRDLETALSNAEAVLKSYRGLPTDWMQEMMLMVGDIDVAMNQLPQAEAAYKDYQRAYPAAGAADVNVGLARIDVSKKDFAAAKAKIDPIIAQALKLQNPPKAAAALIGRAFYVSGQIKEQSGDLPGALEDYLRTAVIFPEDRVAAASAQERADALRKDHGTAVP
jgi:tetratricopeptide (TPR) repeat protein